MRILQKSILENLLDHYDNNVLLKKHNIASFKATVEQITNRWYYYEHVKDINYLAKNFTLHKDEFTDINKVLTDLVWFKTISKTFTGDVKKPARKFYNARFADLKKIAQNTEADDFKRDVELFNDAITYVLSFTLSNIIKDNVEPTHKTIKQITKYKRNKEIAEIKTLSQATDFVVDAALSMSNEKTLSKKV